jgi:eukaryotic-like serine/threonine-protein kinase
MGRNLIDQRYELRTLVGSGGMADVYLAGDEVLGREVALKLLKDRYAENEEFVERFRREAKSAAVLSSTYIVPIFDRGETDDGTYYITMEYLPGGTLKERIMATDALRPRRQQRWLSKSPRPSRLRTYAASYTGTSNHATSSWPIRIT